MKTGKTIALMKELTEISGISGNEFLISSRLRSYYSKLADEVVYDNLGSIYAVKKSFRTQAPRVMVSGHMDEVGFITTDILSSGMIKALPLGRVALESLLGAKVKLSVDEEKNYRGVIIVSENQKALGDDGKVMIDLGLSSKVAVKNLGIRIGSVLSFDNSFYISEDERVFAQNWDGRYGPIMGVELLQELKDINLPFDLYIGCTVQEQVGQRGIQTATNLVAPDLAITLDTKQAYDYQENVLDKIGMLGKGMLLTFYDKTILPNRLLLQKFRSLCESENIPHQDYYSLEESEAGWVNKLRTGCPVLLANIPVRNIGTSYMVIDKNDYISAKLGILKFIMQLSVDQIKSFKEENR